jgi:hypothetical protein
MTRGLCVLSLIFTLGMAGAVFGDWSNIGYNDNGVPSNVNGGTGTDGYYYTSTKPESGTWTETYSLASYISTLKVWSATTINFGAWNVVSGNAGSPSQVIFKIKLSQPISGATWTPGATDNSYALTADYSTDGSTWVTAWNYATQGPYPTAVALFTGNTTTLYVRYNVAVSGWYCMNSIGTFIFSAADTSSCVWSNVTYNAASNQAKINDGLNVGGFSYASIKPASGDWIASYSLSSFLLTVNVWSASVIFFSDWMISSGNGGSPSQVVFKIDLSEPICMATWTAGATDNPYALTADYSTDGSTWTTAWNYATQGAIPTTVTLPTGTTSSLYFRYNVASSGWFCMNSTGTFTFTPSSAMAATPTFSPSDRYYNQSVNVTIISTTADADIYYTLNGNDPTTSDNHYTGAITLSSGNTTLKAIAVKHGLLTSNVASKEYGVLSARKSSGNQIVNGNFNDLSGWEGWSTAGSVWNNFGFCGASSWTSSLGVGTVTVGTGANNTFAQGTHNATWGSFGLYQVVPVFKGALYTVTADWMSSTGLMDEHWYDGSWCEFIVYCATAEEINNMTTVLFNNNDTFTQASIIAKKDTYTNLNGGCSSWDWDAITNSMSGGFDNGKGTNTFKATTDYMVVMTKYLSMNGVCVAWDNVSLSVTAPGDANADSKVDVGDLGILAANYGMTEGATWGLGDFNGDGKVDVGDLGILAANYGIGSSNTLSWADAYAQAFGTTTQASDDSADDSEDTVSSLCSSMGLSLIAGLAMMGLMIVRLEE